MTLKIFIHVGAHKTASTHFEQTLSKNSELLDKRGVAVLPPAMVREHLTPLAMAAKDAGPTDALRADMAETLRQLAPEAETLLISDENLLGGTDAKMLFDGGQLYPWGPQRVARLVALLPDAKIKIAVATRSYDSFLGSAYGESLHHTRYQSFGDYLGGVAPENLSWPDLIIRLRDASEIPVMTWRFEEYPAIARRVIGEMVGKGVAKRLEMLPRPARVGPSAAAIEAYAEAAEWAPDIDFRELKKRFPRNQGFPAFVAYRGSRREELQARYATDIAATKELVGVRLIEKPARKNKDDDGSSEPNPKPQT